MKKIIKQGIGFFILLALVFLVSGKAEAAGTATEDRTAVVIDGIQYNLTRKNNVTASIDDVRGEQLPSELYVPKKLEYQGETYTIKQFSWGDIDRYMTKDGDWNLNVAIQNKENSYHSRLKTITFAKGVMVCGYAYEYDNLENVILENPEDLYCAYYYSCPKLKRLHLTSKMSSYYGIDIKNCPSLYITIDPANQDIMVLDGDIYSKNGKILLDVICGQKNYVVKKGVEKVRSDAMWGNTAIRNVYLPNSVKNGSIDGLPNLRFVRFGKKMEQFHFGDIEHCAKIKKLYLPKKVRTIYCYEEQMKWIDKIYLYCNTLKKAEFIGNTKRLTFYVKNNTVKKQLQKAGCKGKIIVKKNMKPYDKIKWKK